MTPTEINYADVTYPNATYGVRDMLAAEAAPCTVLDMHQPEQGVWIVKVRFAHEDADDTLVVVPAEGQFEVCDR